MGTRFILPTKQTTILNANRYPSRPGPLHQRLKDRNLNSQLRFGVPSEVDLIMNVGINEGSLRGYRNPLHPAGFFGELDKTTLAGKTIWQLASSITVLQIGLNGAPNNEEFPGEKFPGIDVIWCNFPSFNDTFYPMTWAEGVGAYRNPSMSNTGLFDHLDDELGNDIPVKLVLTYASLVITVGTSGQDAGYNNPLASGPAFGSIDPEKVFNTDIYAVYSNVQDLVILDFNNKQLNEENGLGVNFPDFDGVWRDILWDDAQRRYEVTIAGIGDYLTANDGNEVAVNIGYDRPAERT